MNRLLGVFLMVVVLYGGLVALDEQFVQGPYADYLDGDARGLQKLKDNHKTIANRVGFFGILTVGAGVLILAGGIDLSIGSVVGLGAVCFGLMLEAGISPWLAAPVVLAGSVGIGVIHGLLVTKLKLQPFLVTLCGLFIYRGVARLLAPGAVGLGVDLYEKDPAFRDEVQTFRALLVGDPLGVPQQLLLLILVCVVLGLFLHGTKHGRYLFAIGANEDAARYAGIATDRYKVLAYVICSGLAGLGSILEMLDTRSVLATNAGQLWELYAITGAVLGGCSLRGGEGLVPGMFLGAAVLPLLRQLCTSVARRSEWDYVVIGLALLLGTVADELLKRRARRRGG